MPLVIREDTGPVARLTLNRLDALNALSSAMLGEIQTALDDLATDRAGRAVVVAGAGRAFRAGHDLSELKAAREEPDGGATRLKALFDACALVMPTLPHLPQPVIAEGGGHATVPDANPPRPAISRLRREAQASA